MTLRSVGWTLIGVLIASLAHAQERTVAPSLVFDGVTVVDVEHGTLLQAQRVVITGNRIQAVGGPSQVSIPQGAQLVDARGKYLIPGLWDMHVHPQTGWNQNQASDTYQILLGTGVTGFRNAHSPSPLADMVEWRQEILAGTRIGPPRQILGGPPFNDPEGGSCSPDVLACADYPEIAGQLIDSLKSAGVDMIKMYNLSRDMYFAVAAAARRAGLRFGGHVGLSGHSPPVPQPTATDAADSGASIVDHINAAGIDKLCFAPSSATAEQCRSLAETFRRHNTWWVPTISIFFNFFTDVVFRPGSLAVSQRLKDFSRKFAEGGVMPSELFDSTTVRAIRESHADTLGMLQLAKRVDLPMLAGTDAIGVNGSMMQLLSPANTGSLTGYTLHGELAVYVAEGLSPLDALRSATLNPAKMLQATDSLGTVAPGKLADLVLLDANPLEDITNTTAIRAVVANGRYFDRAALDDVLNEVRNNSKNP